MSKLTRFTPTDPPLTNAVELLGQVPTPLFGVTEPISPVPMAEQVGPGVVAAGCCWRSWSRLGKIPEVRDVRGQESPRPARWLCPRQSGRSTWPSRAYPVTRPLASDTRDPGSRAAPGRQKTGDGMAALVERRRTERPDFAGSERHRGRPTATRVTTWPRRPGTYPGPPFAHRADPAVPRRQPSPSR